MNVPRPKVRLGSAAPDERADTFRAPLPVVDRDATRDTARQHGFDRSIEERPARVDRRTLRRSDNDAQLNLKVPRAMRDQFWVIAAELGFTSGADMIGYLMTLQHERSATAAAKGQGR